MLNDEDGQNVYKIKSNTKGNKKKKLGMLLKMPQAEGEGGGNNVWKVKHEIKGMKREGSVVWS